MDKKSVIEELSSIDEEGKFLKELIEKMESLIEEELKVVLEKEIEYLSFNLDNLTK